MSERISALMDGEFEAQMPRDAYADLAREGAALEAWRTYHVIGDALRDTPPRSAGFSARLAARLTEEPTVLAPREPHAAARPRARGLQIAASVAAVALVGWVAFAPQFGVQRGPELALAPSAPAAKPPAEAPNVPLPSAAADYLLAHQAYSPRGNLQGVAPYVRTVSESVRRK